jgi:glycosidase
MIALRKEHSALREGHQWTIGASEKYFVYLRDDGREKILVVFNTGDQAVKLELRDTPIANATLLQPLLGAAEASVENGSLTVEHPEYGVALYSVK